MQYLHIALTALATAQTMRSTEKFKIYDNTKKLANLYLGILSIT
jgi:hypothetical protein